MPCLIQNAPSTPAPLLSHENRAGAVGICSSLTPDATAIMREAGSERSWTLGHRVDGPGPTMTRVGRWIRLTPSATRRAGERRTTCVCACSLKVGLQAGLLGCIAVLSPIQKYRQALVPPPPLPLIPNPLLGTNPQPRNIKTHASPRQIIRILSLAKLLLSRVMLLICFFSLCFPAICRTPGRTRHLSETSRPPTRACPPRRNTAPASAVAASRAFAS